MDDKSVMFYFDKKYDNDADQYHRNQRLGGIHGDYAYHSDMTKAQMMTLIMFRR